MTGSLWMTCGTAANQGGTRNDAPRADRTLDPTPRTFTKGYRRPHLPRQGNPGPSESKTSLRLIENGASARAEIRIAGRRKRAGARLRIEPAQIATDKFPHDSNDLRTYVARRIAAKVPILRTVSLRISGKPPSLRDSGVTGAWRAAYPPARSRHRRARSVKRGQSVPEVGFQTANSAPRDPCPFRIPYESPILAASPHRFFPAIPTFSG